MKMHITFGQIPEIRDLSSAERKQVYLECIHPLLMRWPVRIIKFTYTLALFIGALSMGLWDSIAGFTCFVLIFVIADHLFDVTTISFMRTQLRNAMACQNIGRSTQA
jgi:hypothetical protein